MAAPLTLRLLGGFALHRGDELVPVSGRKSRALLAYVALQPGRSHSREKLATLLWGDRFDKQARQSLRQAIAVLRKEIGNGEGELLFGDREQVTSDAAALASDVREFEDAAASDTDAGLWRAIELYRGDLLPDFSAEAEEFDAWLVQERHRLRGIAETAFERLARRLARSDRGDDAIDIAQRLVALDPAAEAAQRLLIELYASFRGRDAGLRQFERCVEALRRELDAAPSAETLQLVQRIRNGTVSAPAVAVPRAAAGPGKAPAVRTRSARIALLAGATATAIAGAVLWVALTAVPLRQSGVPSSTGDAAGAAASADHGAHVMPFSVVVLPFSDYSNPGNTSLAEAITDDLTTDMSLVPDTVVIARATAVTYAGKTGDIKAIGRELGVRYALEGGVRLADGQLRINAELVDTGTGKDVWARRFTGERGERLRVQDELIGALINEVFFEVSLLDAVRSARDRPENPALEDFLIRGRAARLRGPTPQNIAEARAMYAQALRIAPDSLFAQQGLAAAYVHGVLQMQSEAPEHDLDEAQALIARVLEAEPRCYFCWFIQGQIKRVRGQFEAAIADWQHSLDINPSFPHAYVQIGSTLPYLGRAAEMGAYMDHAMRLSPHDPMVPLWLSMRGGVELLLGHDQVAVDMLRQSAASLRLARNYRLLAAALELTGDQEGARSAVAAFRSLAGRGVQRPAEEAYIQNPAYLQQRARVSAALQRLGL